MAAELLIFAAEQAAAASMALLVVMALRNLARRAFSARSAYALWLVVPAVMLAVALPRLEQAPDSAQTTSSGALSVFSQMTSPPVSAQTAAEAFDPPSALSLSHIVDGVGANASGLMALWAVGAALFSLCLMVGQRRYVSGLGALRREEDAHGAIFHAKAADVGPALVGALRPRIVVPADFHERFSLKEQALILAHERTHLRGGDAQINLAVAAFQAIFWFNPLAHLGSRLLRIDQELACDETIAAHFPRDRRLYAQAMLKTQLCEIAAPLGCHWLAGRKVELQRRIRRLNTIPNTTRRITGLGLAVAAALAGAVAAWAAQPAQAPISQPAPKTQTPSDRALIQAVKNGQVSEAAQLLAAGASADARSDQGASALLLAVERGELSLTRRLLDGGADPNAAGSGDGTALIIAAGAGDLAIARLLIERGADVNLASIGDGNALINAAASGHLEMMDLLLNAGAQINAAVIHDETALITAARRGQFAAVRRLVEAGADVNQVVMAPRTGRPAEARSALSMARRSGRADIVAYLRAHGASA